MSDLMSNEVRGRRSPSHAALERDAALDRVGRTKRWAILGTAGLTAGFAALVSSVAPGKTLKHGQTVLRSAAATTTRPRPTGATKMPPLASASALGLQGPSQAPQSDSTQSAAPDPSQQAPDPSQAAPAQTTPAPVQQAPAQTTPAPVQQAPAPATSGGS
jgi:hypothetical protein